MLAVGIDGHVNTCTLSVICHVYNSHPELLRSAYRALLSKFFDTEKRHKFYQMPRIVSEQLISLSKEKRNMSQRFLDALVKARREDMHDQDDDDDDDDDDEEEEEQ